DALVGVGRRHPDVDHGDVGAVGGHDPEQRFGVAHGGDDLAAAVVEQLGQPGLEQHGVLGDHDPHGSSTVIAVGPPGGLSTVRVPSTPAARWVSPRSRVPAPSAAAPPPSRVAPPRPSSLTTMRSRSPTRTTATSAEPASACLAPLGGAWGTAK